MTAIGIGIETGLEIEVTALGPGKRSPSEKERETENTFTTIGHYALTHVERARIGAWEVIRTSTEGAFQTIGWMSSPTRTLGMARPGDGEMALLPTAPAETKGRRS